MIVKSKYALLIAILLLLCIPTIFGFGMITGAGRSLTDLEKLNFQRLMLGSSLISAFATFAAVAAALRIAAKQASEARRKDLQRRGDDAIKTLHYAMALTEDLRGRVTGLKTKLCTVGSYPLSVLTLTTEGFIKRYEAFYDIELYLHLPGPIIDQITKMSGSFVGVNTMISTIASEHQNKLHTIITVSAPRPTKIFDDFYEEIDELFTSLEKQRQIIGQQYPT